MSKLFTRLGAALRRSTVVMVAVGVLMGGSVVAAAPASAAVHYCNEHLASAGWVPVNFNASPDTACYQNQSNYTVAGTKAIQRSYNECYAERLGYRLPNGGKLLVADGVYGDLTAAAVRNVQKHHGLSQDGLYGPTTASKFRSHLFSDLCVHWTP